MTFETLAGRIAQRQASTVTLIGVAVTDPDTGHVQVDVGGRVFPATIPASVTGVVEGVPVRVTTSGVALTVESVGAGRAVDWTVGDVKWFWGTEAQAEAQVGWVVMDGRSFSSTTYPALFAHLGGTTMPDMTDRFPRGAGSTSAKGTGGTDEITEDMLPPHDHSTWLRTTATFTASYGATFYGIASGTAYTGDGPGSSDPFVPEHAAAWFLMRAV